MTQYFKCPECYRVKEAADKNTILYPCPGCQIPMLPVRKKGTMYEYITEDKK